MTQPTNDIARDAEIVLALGRRAASLVLAIYQTDFEVEMKGPGDPVTRADKEANVLLCEGLASAFPHAAVVAEESAPEDDAALASLLNHEVVFFVDPLDGTREFAAKNGEFAVMIGRTVGGVPDLGVVVLPATGEALVGAPATSGRAALAFHEDARQKRRPLGVSSVRDPAAARLMVSRSHRPRIVQPVCQGLGITRAIPCGSVGLKVGRIATGDAELYVHGGGGAKRWDTCAPEAILLAAGGLFTDLDGARIDYRSVDLTLRRGIVASNGLLQDAALRAVAGYASSPGAG